MGYVTVPRAWLYLNEQTRSNGYSLSLSLSLGSENGSNLLSLRFDPFLIVSRELGARAKLAYKIQRTTLGRIFMQTGRNITGQKVRTVPQERLQETCNKSDEIAGKSLNNDSCRRRRRPINRTTNEYQRSRSNVRREIVELSASPLVLQFRYFQILS